MRAARDTLGIAVIFTLMTVVMTWPQAALLRTHVASHFDPYFSMWRLGWIAHQLARSPRRLFDGNIFYPQRLTLALSDPILLPGTCAAPLLWLGVPLVPAYNLLILASFVLSGTAAWALASRLTGSSAAGLIAGIVYAFAPYRFGHYHHLEILWGCWIPLALLMLHRTIDRGTVVAGLRTGLVIIAQTLSCLYYGVYLAITMTVATPLLLDWRNRSRLRVLAGLAAGAAAAFACLAIYVQPLLAVRHDLIPRPLAETVQYSATLASYFSTRPENRVYGELTDFLGAEEMRLFPGLAAILLAVGALLRPSRTALVYVAILIFAVVVSLGTNTPVFPIMRRHINMLALVRVPARFGAIALCAMAVLSAIGLAALLQTIASSSIRRLVVAVFCAAMLIEYSTAMRLEEVRTDRASVYRWLAHQPRGPVAELPMPRIGQLMDREAQREFFSTSHWQPLLNGYSGYFPIAYDRLVRRLRAFPHGAWVDLLLDQGAQYIVLHERDTNPDTLREALLSLERSPRVRRIGRLPDAVDPAWVYERVQ